MYTYKIPSLLAALLLTILFSGCPVVSVPDGSGGSSREMPLVTVEINNTPETIDDYTDTGSIPCRIRLTNHKRFDAAVAVRLKNIDVLDEKLRFSATSGGTYNGFLLRSLPDDGAWVNFHVRGSSGNFSSRDKDAIIEVVENRVNLRNVVLARKAMMTTNNPPALTATRVEIQVIGTSGTIDDYLTWSPHLCKARIVNAAAVTDPLTVRLRNMPGAVGQLRFATNSDLQPTTNTNDATVTDYHTATRTTLDLTLPANGDWRNFYVAGLFGSPSVEDKDAVIEATSTGGGTMYGRFPVMVRVRKNGNTLADVERDRFLEVVRSLQPRGGVAFDRWLEFIEQHAVGTDEGHTGPGFLPWHRVYVMRLERDLQALDPSVAIPYWRPDQVAPNIFHVDFLGRDGSGALVDLDINNPLSTWSINTGSSVVTGIQRNALFNNVTGTPSGINSEADVFAFGNEYEEVRSPLESNPHGRAHTQATGSGGWVRNFFTSPRDPLFFLIHGNVDHIWAKWQIRQRRTMHADFEDGYYAQGTFPGSGGMVGEHKGHYLMDEMWPWNEEMGGGTSGLADRPASSYGAFPQTVGQILMMPGHPRPYDVIDYRVSKWIQGNTPNFNQGIGFAYDDVPFNTAL